MRFFARLLRLKVALNFMIPLGAISMLLYDIQKELRGLEWETGMYALYFSECYALGASVL